VQRWAGVICSVYDRIDTGERKLVWALMPYRRILPDTVNRENDGYLLLNYGAAAAVASVKLAQKVVELENHIVQQDKVIRKREFNPTAAAIACRVG